MNNTKTSSARLITAVLLALAMLATPASAQPSPGIVSGVVADPDTTTVPGAEVQLLNARRKVVHKTATAEDGTFRLEGVPPGTYSLRVTARGFYPATVRRVRVTSDRTTEVKVDIMGKVEVNR